MNPPAGLSLASPVPSAGAAAPLRERLCATPRLACEALARAIGRGELEAALSCFSSDGCLVGAEGTVAQGEHALAASLSGLIEAEAKVRIELYGVLVAGDIALAHERWQISYRGIPDPRLPQDPSPSLVLRLLEGQWRIAIAAPWGLAASEPLRGVGF